MLRVANLLQKALLLIALLIALTSNSLAAGISATATYTSSQVSPGLYDYALTLNNTGSTTIGTFWFGWVPGAGFLSAAPTAVTSPAGWSSLLTNTNSAIQWTSTTNLLAAGQSLSGFSFASSETPAQLLLNFTGTGIGAGDPVTTSFVYITTRGANGDLGAQIVAAPAVAATPEPGSLLLAFTGFAMTAISTRRRLFSRS